MRGLVHVFLPQAMTVTHCTENLRTFQNHLDNVFVVHHLGSELRVSVEIKNVHF